ncbi:MAG: zinc ribbon domain-containing protein, partial [Planctomycetia bacterium]|nr:zinc ribbon domain-containing protein [Planctomycetia bacterium]
MTTSARPKPTLPGSDNHRTNAKSGVTTCGYCHGSNGADRRFCGECGKPLWEKCPACQAECRSGEAFCGGCGINLREYLKTRIDGAETALANAAARERAGDLNEATRLLRSVRLPDHRELTGLSEQIAAEMRRLTELVARQTHDVEADLSRASALLAACAFSDAVRLLEMLPKEFQTEESDRLLAEAMSKQEETLRLKAEIREAVERKQLLDLAPKIQRLLTLQPDADGVQRLAGQVRDRLLAAANKRLNAYEYRQARELVARVPECAIDETTKQLSEKIAEFTWIESDLELAPLVDSPLLEIAKRFAKKAPGDKKNAERCSKIFRLAEAPA